MTTKYWISSCKHDKKKALCKLCDRAIDLSTMAVSMRSKQVTEFFDSSTTLATFAEKRKQNDSEAGVN